MQNWSFFTIFELCLTNWKPEVVQEQNAPATTGSSQNHSSSSNSSNNSGNSNNTSNTKRRNTVQYKSTATLHFEIYDNVNCITKSNLSVSAVDNYCVYSVDSYYHTATIGGGSSSKGVRGNYRFSWSMVNDCGISTPSSSDYKSYSGSFFIDGLHSDYYIEVYSSYIQIRSN